MNKECQSIVRRIFTVQRYFKIFLNYKLKRHGLNSAQFMVLLILTKEDGLSQEAINEGLQFDKGFLAKVAKSLEKDGYIIRKVNQEDRRAYELFLTDKTKALKSMIFEILDEWDSTVLEGVNEREIDILNGTLEGMLERVAKKCKEVKEDYNEKT
ncbi:MarR family winged helix-turn-helix transcriptional regulator [Wukongibacter sp. M2B1]|uniref:MarR family winged helix-turn-helix transcriptional regulator n=1 Tax=Wukongibacter sp. M2B1 TaxID=3088895 RepID=UPI003D790B95